jgi:hypothetical protein
MPAEFIPLLSPDQQLGSPFLCQAMQNMIPSCYEEG